MTRFVLFLVDLTHERNNFVNFNRKLAAVLVFVDCPWDYFTLDDEMENDMRNIR